MQTSVSAVFESLKRLLCDQGVDIPVDELDPSATRDYQVHVADPRIHAHTQRCHDYICLVVLGLAAESSVVFLDALREATPRTLTICLVCGRIM